MFLVVEFFCKQRALADTSAEETTLIYGIVDDCEINVGPL